MSETFPEVDAGLRYRNISPTKNEDGVSINHRKSNPSPVEEELKKDDPDRKTFGRTPGGETFQVPTTHDMVSQLLSPSQPKNIFDLVVIIILLIHISGLFYLPPEWRSPVFGCAFLFWRLCYNAGIGYLLNIQSNFRRLVVWAKRTGIFEPPESGRNKFPFWYKLLKHEMEVKIPQDYKFEEAPTEYNTWLLFRRVVDLILMCDFASYCLFAISCFSRPANESIVVGLGRWALGIALFLFNLWVKLDAHRVVKDYAWYWGDFFFLIDQDLTFDGVFEMAPHPMYSVGYAGYYGISLMAASYRVLMISIAAHAAQFAFLILVENPHIEKTYNPDAPKGMIVDEHTSHDELKRTHRRYTASKPSTLHNLMGIKSIDFHRLAHLGAVLVAGYITVWALSTPNTPWVQAIFVLNALGWRLWYTVGIGYILTAQSCEKRWTRHFIKYGESVQEAWTQWKSLYYISMVAYNFSFVAAAYKMYHLPADWSYGLVMLRHILGCALICLQIWTSVSIFDTLGEFGWFFGDFFFDESPKLAYDGIYRFLNNPERVLGLAGAWGFALITWSRAIFLLALLSHILTLSFIEFVEQPHMQKLYGKGLRQDSGLSKSLKKTLPEPIRNWQTRVDQVLSEARDILEDFVKSTGPQVKAGVDTLLKDSSAMLKSYPGKIKLSVQSLDRTGLPPREVYDISVQAQGSRKYGGTTTGSVELQPLTFEYSVPIKVRWRAPKNHDKKDWIGLYKVSDGSSRLITHASSQGRWIATEEDAYENTQSASGIISSNEDLSASDPDYLDYVTGEVQFSGRKLWWTPGVYEIRYHHGSTHHVMDISAPFEIRLEKFEDGAYQKRAERRQKLRRSATNTPLSKTPNMIDSPGTSTPPMDGRFSKSRFGSLMGEEILARLADSYDDCDSDYESENNPTRVAIETALLPIVQNCFDRDPSLAPETVTDVFGRTRGHSRSRSRGTHNDAQTLNLANGNPDATQEDSSSVVKAQKPGEITPDHASRITFAINRMFGIELHPTVVPADGSVRRLATRLCFAKRVLEKSGIVDGV